MKPLSFALSVLLAAFSSSLATAQDTSLHEYLIDGEPWREAVTGQAFTDGLCTDAAGNLFFTDVRNGKGVYRLDPASGQVTLVHDGLPGISGLQFGPDGRLYATHNKEQRVIAISPDGKIDVLATGVKCNDLVVTRKGFVYFTETPTQRVHLITPGKEHRIADEGKVTRPNGISISPDEQTLAVSDHGGKHVWAWRIEADGSLTAGAPFMTMWLPLPKEHPVPAAKGKAAGKSAPAKGAAAAGGKVAASGADPGQAPGPLGRAAGEGKVAAKGKAAASGADPGKPAIKEEAFGDGMTTEEKGRWFVTTEVGLQIFDPAGRLAGIIAKPVPTAKIVSCEFAGKDHDTIFIASGDKIFSRKLKVRGYFGR